MKKLISILVSVAMVISMAPSAFAAQPNTSTRTQDGIIGTILYEDTLSINGTSNTTHTTGSTSSSATNVDIIVSSVNNQDGSVTIYEYHDNLLSQYHTTFPGSGVLYSTYIDEDGSSRSETTFTKSSPSVTQIPVPDTLVATRATTNYTSTESNINNPTSVRNLGYMHYRHTFTDTFYSISCEVIERYHPNEEFTFNETTGGEISFWVGSILSVFMLTAPAGTILAKAIVQKLITAGIIALGFGTTYFGVGSTTIRCNWYEQEIHGTPTAPSGRGKEIYLSGIYAYVDYGNGPEVETEGYTVRDWGNPTMGRWMMYNVFGIDESPTSWSNLNSISAPSFATMTA